MGIEYTAPSQVDALYTEGVETLATEEGTFYRAVVNGQVRYAALVAGPGLWGTIRGIIAVDHQVERIQGFRIITHNETPGLGGRIDEGWFTAQFTGEKIPIEGIRIRQGSGLGDTDPNNGELDAVTGASRTSQAVQDIVNRELSVFLSLRDKGGLK
ncbi:MAG: FMN-binding protein [Termitinemataceae bacterium]